MINLLTPIYNIINPILTSYYTEAPQDAALPYAVYTASVSSTLYEQETTMLEIDIWDDNKDMTNLLTYTKSIKDALKKFNYADANVGFSCRLITNQPIADPDENIKRRKLVFQILNYYV